MSTLNANPQGSQQRMVRAHWEHGYRTHGYWSDVSKKRLGAVGIGPRKLWDGIYRWWLDSRKHTDAAGEAKTLKAAKAAVERAVAAEQQRPNT